MYIRTASQVCPVSLRTRQPKNACTDELLITVCACSRDQISVCLRPGLMSNLRTITGSKNGFWKWVARVLRTIPSRRGWCSVTCVEDPSGIYNSQLIAKLELHNGRASISGVVDLMSMWDGTHHIVIVREPDIEHRVSSVGNQEKQHKSFNPTRISERKNVIVSNQRIDFVKRKKTGSAIKLTYRGLERK